MDAVIVSGREELLKAVDAFYSALLGTTRNPTFAVDLDTLEIPSHVLVHLEAPITKYEVWAVVKDHPPDKAPRSDGFTGRFYKSSWVVIKGTPCVQWTIIHGVICVGLEASIKP